MSFNYNEAFGRNIGLLTEGEQARLRSARVALAGLGGVGGAHLETLARMGIGAFHLADPDHYELANLNRQLGAQENSFGRSKAAVQRDVLQAINPEAEVEVFEEGVQSHNMDAFLKDVDVVVDGIEFFAFDARAALHAAARAAGIPVVIAGPIGYGACLFIFRPDDISFEKYFRWDQAQSRTDRMLTFAAGLSPGLVNDVDPASVDLKNGKGPALSSACMLCAGFAGTAVIQLLVRPHTIAKGPQAVYFDPLRLRKKRLRRPPPLRSWRGRILKKIALHRYPELRTE